MFESQSDSVEQNTSNANKAAVEANRDTNHSMQTLTKTIGAIQVQANNTENSVKVI